MNSEKSKTSYPHRLSVNLSHKIILKRSDKLVALSNLSIWKNIKSHTKIINLKYQLRHGYEQFELYDGSYSVSDIQDYFEYIFKKHEVVTDNPSML